MHLLQCFRDVNRTTKSYDGIAFRVRRCQARDKIRDPGPRGGYRDPCLTRHTADTACNERGILLVSANYGFDFRVDERVENSVDLGAWNPKDVAYTLGFKGTNNELRANVLGLVVEGDFSGCLYFWWLLL
jgi:hypothetical protein